MDNHYKPFEWDELQTADGLVVKLNNGRSKWLFGVSGQGMPPIDWLTDTGPFQHGSTPKDFRLRPRVLQYAIRWDKACDRGEYWDLRMALLEAVRPNRSTSGATFGQLILRKRFPLGASGPAVLEILAVIDDGPRFEMREIDKWDERAFNETLRFIAHDPVFTDPTARSGVTIPITPATQLVFPISFPITFGGDALAQTVVCITAGTWKVYPVMVLDGPMSDPTITNLTTGEAIELAYIIPSGGTVTIDLSYGVKSVTDEAGINRIGTVTPESDLAEFHLAPDPEAAGGVNNISVTAANVDASTRMTIQWYDRYIGL